MIKKKLQPCVIKNNKEWCSEKLEVSKVQGKGFEPLNH